jgi:arylsulfatase A-like enzyme
MKIFILSFIFTCATFVSISQTKPNIILFMTDDQGWGDVAYNGHKDLKTPNLDDLAKSGLRFDNFYSAAPVCSPTRGSVMTGRHPNRFGCFNWGYTLRPQEVTIAEALKTAGYVTGHFGKWHIGSVRTGSPVNPGASGFDEWLAGPNFFDLNPILSRKGIATQFQGESSIVTVDAAIEFIRENADSHQPFFTVVWVASPHTPFRAAEEDKALYSHLEEDLQNFYGEITGMDRAFGKLRQELKTLGIDQNTILWYSGDNGEVGSEWADGYKGQIYEGGLRIPAVLEWPARIPVPRVSKVPGNTSDIYPTLLEVAGVKVENQPILDGVSLLPVIDNKTDARTEPMGFWKYPRSGKLVWGNELMADLLEEQKAGKMINDPELLDLNAGDTSQKYPEDNFPGHAAWLDWPFKLHRIQSESGNIEIELYNLEQDPKEQNDLASRNSAQVTLMRSQIELWLRSVTQSLNGEDYK